MAKEWWREQRGGGDIVGLLYRAAVLYTTSPLLETSHFESFVYEELAACDVVASFGIWTPYAEPR